MAEVTQIRQGIKEPDPDNKSTIFISHRMEDGQIAKIIGDALKNLSDRIELYVAGNWEHRNAEFGAPSLKESIAKVLHKTEVVLILYTQVDEDWSWVMWETGVATDPSNPSKTRIVPLSLSENAPSVFDGQLVVRANDQNALRAFFKQICTKEGFFPGLEGPLTNRETKWINDQADALHAELKKIPPLEAKRWRRCDRFKLLLEAKAVKQLQAKKALTKQLVQTVAECSSVVEPSVEVGRHFGLAAHLEAPTLDELRASWESCRKDVGLPMAETRPWTAVLVEEIWRICNGKSARLNWEPFLSVYSNDWLYPLVIEYAELPTGAYEFDVAVVSTLEPGEKVPGK